MTTAAAAFCAYHHRTPATATCTICGKTVCDLCRREVNTRALCVGCGVGRETQMVWLAAAFSLVLPGAGQLYNGDLRKALAIFLLAPLVVPWLWGVLDAARTAEAIATGQRDASTVPTGGVLLALKLAWVPVALIYGGVLALALTAIGGALAALLA